MVLGVKRARKQSVFRSLFLMGLVLSMVLLASFAVMNRQMRLIRRENVLDTNQLLMEQIQDKIDEYGHNMTQIATATVYSPTVYTCFFQDSVQRAISVENVNMVFSNIMLIENNIAGIYLFDKESELIASMGNGTQESENMRFIHVQKERQEYSSLFYLSNSSMPYYAFYFPVFDLNSQIYGQQIGMCVFIMKTDKLVELMQDGRTTTYAQLYLVDRDNRVLAVLGGEDIEELTPDRMESTADYYVAEMEMPVGGWRLVSRIPKRDISETADDSLEFYAGGYVLALGLLLCMILFVYWRLLLPIREMDSFVRRVSIDSGARMDIRRQDEIGTVEAGMNQMLDNIEEKNIQIQAAREKVYQMESAEKQLQILAYRNQINPHFLYNTLDCIRGMALYHDEEEIAEITVALSKLFRFAVKGGNIVRVEEEIAHIKEYARIIDYRFHGRIKVKVEAEDEVKKKSVIKFLLQPLIENAVFHGLEKKLDGGEVRAKIYREKNDRICCIVEDDGCGIDAGKLKELKADFEDNEKQKGIGMANIYQRLRLFYGEEAFFSIDSTENKGTKVVISIPDLVDEGAAADV